MAQIDDNDRELLTIKDHIDHLRCWLQQQKPDLNSLDTDEFLLRFLRITDFRLENAKERLIQFWRYRTENPQWFQNRDLLKSSLMYEVARLGYCLKLPKVTKDKHLLLVLRLGQYNPSKYTFDDVTRYAFAVADMLNSKPAAQLYGLIIIFDFTNIRLHHLTQFTPDRLRRYISCWEKMYPVHIRQIHFYNYPSILNSVLYVFRLFYSRKFNDRMVFHSRTSNESVRKSLHDFIDPALLPSEYGGQLDSIQGEINQSFIQWTHERNDHIVQLEEYGVDLKKVSQLMKNIRQKQMI